MAKPAVVAKIVKHTGSRYQLFNALEFVCIVLLSDISCSKHVQHFCNYRKVMKSCRCSQVQKEYQSILRRPSKQFHQSCICYYATIFKVCFNTSITVMQICSDNMFFSKYQQYFYLILPTVGHLGGA